MKTTLDLPLYRPKPQLKRHPIDVATALRLGQDTLMQEERQRAGFPLISLDEDFLQYVREGLTFKLLQADSRPEDQP